jgi:hypothetical protein
LARAARLAVGGALALGAAGLAVLRLHAPGPSSAAGAGVATLRCPFGAADAGAAAGTTTTTYDRRCSADDDCAVGVHLLDCCGTAEALGIAKGELARFTREGGVCGTAPTCRCMSRGLFAEDGHRASDVAGLADVAVACTAARCTTHVAGTAPSAAATTAPSATASSPTPSAPIATGAPADGDCPLPAPNDCRIPGPCKPSTCICRRGAWVCTPDCSGCNPRRAVPVPSPAGGR